MDKPEAKIELKLGENRVNLEGSEEFVERQYNEVIEEFDLDAGNSGIVTSDSEDSNSNSETGNNGDFNLNDEKLRKLVKKLGVDGSKFNEIFSVDGEHPFILAEDQLPGGNEREILMNASLVLTYIWHEYYGDSRIKTTKLKNAVMDSELPYENFGSRTNADKYDTYFNSRGKGPSASVSLREPGKRKAKSIIKEMVE